MSYPLAESCSQDWPRAPVRLALKHTSLPSPRGLHSEVSIWSLLARSCSGASAEASLWGREGRRLGEIFPRSDLIPSTFLSLSSPPPILLSYPQSVRLQEPCGWSFLNSETILNPPTTNPPRPLLDLPHVLAYHLTLYQCTFP